MHAVMHLQHSKMKIYCFIFLLCILSCSGLEKDFQNQENDKEKYYHYQTRQRQEHSFRLNGNGNDNNDEHFVGNPDIDAKIERPCRVYDLNCIRRYFAEHSNCKIRRGPLPRNLFASQEDLYISRVNLTIALKNVQFGGFRNTRIEEFYINRRTNQMVFAIQIRGFSTFIPSAYFSFFRNGREPIVTVSEGGVLFPSVTFTAIIPNIDDMQLEKAEITTYVDTVPFFFVGPEVASSTDPMAQTLAELFADISTNSQELMLTESQFIPPAYIQYNICDFGLTV